MRKLWILSMFFIATSAIIYSCKSGTSNKATVLKFNLEKGKTYDYDMTWEMGQDIAGQSTKMNIGGVYRVEVTGVDAGITTLKATYESFKMIIKAGGIEINVDTENPTEPSEPYLKMINKLYSGIKGKAFTMRVNEDGTIVGVSGFEAVVRSMVDSLDVPEENRVEAEHSLKDQFNDDAIRDQFAQTFTIFPNKAVKVGDTWQKKFSVKGKTPGDFVTDYTVKSIDGDKVNLQAITKITSADTATHMMGSQNGKLLVDSKTGLILNADIDQDMKMTIQGSEVGVKGKGTVKGTVK